ncbi:MAG: hypothetical protein NC311_17895 [Muribaculaceae bacterium]|nr:hypothetical protein [Muribaculaceae bacterium]
MQNALTEIAEPILTDFSLLPVLYDAYLDVFRERGQLHYANRVYHRKKFLLIVMSLYSPITLVGGRMRTGLRKKLAKLFCIPSESTVSDNIKDLLNYYNLYRDFRRDVDVIYKRMLLFLEAPSTCDSDFEF